jgi:formate dehydrogenase subunit gamma
MIERKKAGTGKRSSLPVVNLAPWSAAVEGAIARHGEVPGGLMPLLLDIQRELRHVPPDSLPLIANALNLSRAEVYGVVSFYHDFRETAAGKHTLRVCRAESCQAVGGEALLAHAQKRLGITLHQTTKDGAISLEPVYCLGNCALSPAMDVDGRVYGMVDAKKFDAIVDALARTGANGEGGEGGGSAASAASGGGGGGGGGTAS